MENSIHKQIKFGDFCKMLEALHNLNKIRGRGKHLKQKDMILSKYVEAFNDFKIKFTKEHIDCYVSFYPILRLLIPSQDKLRTYGLKDSALGRLYIQSLALGDHSSDAKLLKAGTLNKTGTDFGDVVYQIMKDRSKSVETCSIHDINEALDKISELNGRNRTTEIHNVFSATILKLSALEQKWLSKIIIKDLNLNYGTEKILEIYNPAAGQLYKRFDSLKKICEIVESGEEITETIITKCSIELFIAVRPQLCDRMSKTQINEVLGKQELIAETKMDGERMQLHRKGNEYRYFTRQGNDYSNQFGTTPHPGTFSQYVHNIFKVPVTDIILDGEMMVWHRTENRYVVKGENVIVRSIKNRELYQECFVVYDILYLNGVVMIQKPYAERVRLMNTLFHDATGIMLKVNRTKVKTSSEILDVLNKAIDEHEEGIVLKVSDAPYSPGTRGGGWFKIKPDYLGDLVSDLDLVIVGAEYRKGRMYYDNFHVAVKDEANASTKYISIGVVTNTLSSIESSALQATIDMCKRPFHGSVAQIDFGTKKPDVYFEPEKSLIVEIKATELQKSSSNCTGYTLRFPRITNVRRDKPSTDCCTLKEFKDLCGNTSNSGVKKLVKRQATESDLLTAHKNNKISPKRRKLDSGLCAINPYTTTMMDPGLDEIAKGLKICILSSGKGLPVKEDLEVLVKKHGGTAVANPGKDTFVCVAQKEVLLVQKLIESKEQTIVTVDWFLRAFPNNTCDHLIPITPRDVISARPEFEVDLRSKFDICGDKYDEVLTKEKLRHMLEQLNGVPCLMTDEKNYLETEIMGEHREYNIFRGITAFFDRFQFHSVDYVATMLAFISRSGTAEEQYDCIKNCDYVVVDSKNCTALNQIKNKLDLSDSTVLIDYKYFKKLHQGEMTDENEYTI